jgi:epsilon-lactone hydrolase
VNEALSVYRALVQTHDPGQMVAFASSAGGNLLLATVLEAARQGLPMPAAIAVFTPVTDPSGDGDSITAHNGRDGLVANTRIGVPARFYAPGIDLRLPAVSPVYAEYPARFPPTVLTTGTRDLNLSDIVRQFWRLEEAGIDTRLLVGEGCGTATSGSRTCPRRSGHVLLSRISFSNGLLRDDDPRSEQAVSQE